jgi:ligand-binding SRPBCC domain-containing protein
VAQITLKTEIAAPSERCFDLSRSIDLHQLSTANTFEKAIAGRTSGLIRIGETVTWKARHFGIWFTLTSKITAFNYPTHFIDEMESGPFKRLHHLHEFNWNGHSTVMIDYFQFQSPYGLIGKIVDLVILTPYLKQLLLTRNALIKKFAESELWNTILTNQ